ncbi:hemerythrin HHE cation binding domain-containing protein [Nocardiopsis sp. Huas11]|uniref:hemerythrin domain-containing protein n=1 Tax=Nocardiopsis sp. Huas11 TaxID=2183912 RepID=UPI000EAFE485|nr:hemerythrin domain-containing protein [Nocardiopsis sp. Huas11]RKS08169.1 hemerythrin HHE cation binding domain-containing protein [Nocardiopsis sp. Huas11]
MSTERVTALGGELRRVHGKLRDALALARAGLDGGGRPSEAVDDLLLFCHGFCAALSGHHRAEDGSLFPELLRARPDLAPVVAKLTQDHNLIEHLIGGLRRAVAESTDPEVAHSHLDGIEAVMETHFTYEERQLGAVLDGMDADVDRTEIFGPIT